MIQGYPEVFVLLATCSVATAALADKVQEAPISPKISAELRLPLNASAGVLGAGLLCLPKGRAHLSDFVTSGAEFTRLTADALTEFRARVGSVTITDVRVDLTSIESKLCNKSYGMFGLGDKRAHSGKVSFGFDLVVSRANGTQIRTSKVLTLVIEKKSAQPMQAMLPMALKELFSQSESVILNRSV